MIKGTMFFLLLVIAMSQMKSLETGSQGKKTQNIYKADIMPLTENELRCTSALDNDSFLWHKRLGHASFFLLNNLIAKGLILGLPNSKFMEDKICDAYSNSKNINSSFKSKQLVSTS